MPAPPPTPPNTNSGPTATPDTPPNPGNQHPRHPTPGPTPAGHTTCPVPPTTPTPPVTPDTAPTPVTPASVPGRQPSRAGSGVHLVRPGCHGRGLTSPAASAGSTRCGWARGAAGVGGGRRSRPWRLWQGLGRRRRRPHRCGAGAGPGAGVGCSGRAKADGYVAQDTTGSSQQPSGGPRRGNAGLLHTRSRPIAPSRRMPLRWRRSRCRRRGLNATPSPRPRPLTRRAAARTDPLQLARRVAAALNAPGSGGEGDLGFFWVTAVTTDGAIVVANSYGTGLHPRRGAVTGTGRYGQRRRRRSRPPSGRAGPPTR